MAYQALDWASSLVHSVVTGFAQLLVVDAPTGKKERSSWSVSPALICSPTLELQVKDDVIVNQSLHSSSSKRISVSFFVQVLSCEIPGLICCPWQFGQGVEVDQV